MKKHTWQVWTEKVNGSTILAGTVVGKNGKPLPIEFVVEFEGSHTKAIQYYNKNGGSKAGLHIGYDCGD